MAGFLPCSEDSILSHHKLVAAQTYTTLSKKVSELFSKPCSPDLDPH